MPVASGAALSKAREHVARSAQLVDRQIALIEGLERRGTDTSMARALLYTMYRTRLLMIEHLDQIESATARRLRSEWFHPRESLDEWLRLLALAMAPRDNPH